MQGGPAPTHCLLPTVYCLLSTSPVFSSRLSFDVPANRLSAALAHLRGAHVAFDDLTESNPTKVGLTYPPRLLDALAAPSGLRAAAAGTSEIGRAHV